MFSFIAKWYSRTIDWYQRIFLDMWIVALGCSVFLVVGMVLDWLDLVHPR
jgi:hypothetical protein